MGRCGAEAATPGQRVTRAVLCVLAYFLTAAAVAVIGRSRDCSGPGGTVPNPLCVSGTKLESGPFDAFNNREEGRRAKALNPYLKIK